MLLSKIKEIKNGRVIVKDAEVSKEDLLKTKKCPACGAKLQGIKKMGSGNLASEKVLHCPSCHSDF